MPVVIFDGFLEILLKMEMISAIVVGRPDATIFNTTPGQRSGSRNVPMISDAASSTEM
jgi:hypothetical protein